MLTVHHPLNYVTQPCHKAVMAREGRHRLAIEMMPSGHGKRALPRHHEVSKCLHNSLARVHCAVTVTEGEGVPKGAGPHDIQRTLCAVLHKRDTALVGLRRRRRRRRWGLSCQTVAAASLPAR